mmetsp:Transcript_3842/g.12930  ORF Transcript_3842/g.12930 Transcript_3842/m.12930 type:complete len:213 (-) Transcript_3842:1582-2220(-)
MHLKAFHELGNRPRAAVLARALRVPAELQQFVPPKQRREGFVQRVTVAAFRAAAAVVPGNGVRAVEIRLKIAAVPVAPDVFVRAKRAERGGAVCDPRRRARVQQRAARPRQRPVEQTHASVFVVRFFEILVLDKQGDFKRSLRLRNRVYRNHGAHQGVERFPAQARRVAARRVPRVVVRFHLDVKRHAGAHDFLNQTVGPRRRAVFRRLAFV